MGFGSQQAPGSQQSAGGGALHPRRSSLKKQTSRRGLSAFYASKSQSFNCMRDLDNPFCQSVAVMLAKPSPPSPGWPSIAEDMCELHTSLTAYQQQQQLDEYASPRTAVSAPGSPQHSLMRHSWPGSPAADCMADVWLRASPSLAPHHVAEALPGPAVPVPILPSMRSGSLGPSLSGSSSDSGGRSSMDACEVSLDTTVHDACCFPQLQHPTDGLCEAMRAKASLSARPAHSMAAAFGSL